MGLSKEVVDGLLALREQYIAEAEYSFAKFCNDIEDRIPTGHPARQLWLSHVDALTQALTQEENTFLPVRKVLESNCCWLTATKPAPRTESKDPDTEDEELGPDAPEWEPSSGPRRRGRLASEFCLRQAKAVSTPNRRQGGQGQAGMWIRSWMTRNYQ